MSRSQFLIQTFNASTVDCNNLESQVNDAFSYIKLHQKPAFLEIKCFRFREHCGPRVDINFGDRSEEEYAQAERLDWVGNNLNIESYKDGYNEALAEIKKYSEVVRQRLDRSFR